MIRNLLYLIPFLALKWASPCHFTPYLGRGKAPDIALFYPGMQVSDTGEFHSDLVRPGARLIRIAGSFSFAEGPAADRKGNLFFTDQPNDRIWEYGLDGRLRIFMTGTGRANGMYFDRRGNLITCSDLKDQLWSISPQHKVQVLVRNYEGHRLNGPNDLWIDPRGGIYFTDPYYQRPYWTRTRPDLPREMLFYLPPGSHEPRMADSNLVKPNGIIGSRDGKLLYVADIGANKTYRYRIQAPGRLSDRTLFVHLGSDGMTLDDRGDLYLTGHGVHVFNSQGKPVLYIPVPEAWTGNICFAGPMRKTLFMTASKSLYSLQMTVSGAK